jgi:ubiquinone/menaquinone biosynthesis C-methylase UbiE
MATNWDRWRKFNAAYHADDRKFMRFLIPPGKRVLELGCGRGDLLAALEPSYGVGVDFGAETVAKANALHPKLHFVLGDVEDPVTLAGIEGPFDYIVIADTIGMFEDIDGTLRLVHHLCSASTMIIISYYSHLWEPILKLAELLHLRSKQPKIKRSSAKSSGNCCRDDGSASGPSSIGLSPRCLASGNYACGPILSGARSGNFRIVNFR